MQLSPERRLRQQSAASQVAGERGARTIAQTLSLQAKVSNTIALGLMILVGVGLLLWYYTHAATRPSERARQVRAEQIIRAPDEMALPPIGPVQRPETASATGLVTAEAQLPSSYRSTLATHPDESVPALLPAAAPQLRQPSKQLSVPAPASATARSRGPSALQRRLSGGAFASVDEAGGAAASAPDALATAAPWSAAAATQAGVAAQAGADPMAGPSASPAGVMRASVPSDLSMLLRPSTTPTVAASLLPSLTLLLPKGSFIDCTLETALDSTLPGMTTCITATDVFGADGRVVLLERGTKLIGETRGQVQPGAARVFVLWTEARSPNGVTVALDSPATDELGRSGLAGSVERHFWQRFGAAMLISVIDGAIEAAVQSSASRGGTVIYNPGGAQDVMSEVLKGTVAIPPTIVKKNGERVQVLVARDVDFRNVYELRHVSGH